MAMVIQTASLEKFVEENWVVSDPTTVEIDVNGKLGITVATFPATGAMTDPVVVYFVNSPIFELAKELGKDNLTAEYLMGKFESQGLTNKDASEIAEDFAIYHDNYVIIPEECTLCIVGAPATLDSITKPREESNDVIDA